MNICRDCKHRITYDTGYTHPGLICHYNGVISEPKKFISEFGCSKSRHIVSGETNISCDIQRGNVGECGRDGVLFEPIQGAA